MFAYCAICTAVGTYTHTYRVGEASRIGRGSLLCYSGFWLAHADGFRMVLCRVVALFSRINVDSLSWVDLRRGSFGE